jgi:predicted ATPase with chaperone activity
LKWQPLVAIIFLLFGPPGSGKTMAARRLPGILPDLDDADAVAVTTLHSLSGILPESTGFCEGHPSGLLIMVLLRKA